MAKDSKKDFISLSGDFFYTCFAVTFVLLLKYVWELYSSLMIYFTVLSKLYFALLKSANEISCLIESCGTFLARRDLRGVSFIDLSVVEIILVWVISSVVNEPVLALAAAGGNSGSLLVLLNITAIFILFVRLDDRLDLRFFRGKSSLSEGVST